MNQLRSAAEQLRDQGYSYNMITETLGVAKSTMSYWFRDRPFSPNLDVVERTKYGPLKSGARKHNQKVAEIANLKRDGVRELGELTSRDLWMLGLGLYIGEGAKTVETIRLANADPAVIVTTIKWLKQSCGLSDSNIVIRLHLYPDNDVKASLQYWREVTKLPIANFRKVQIDRRQDKKSTHRRKLPFGTAHLTVISRGDPEKGVKLYRRMNGWMAGALGQI